MSKIKISNKDIKKRYKTKKRNKRILVEEVFKYRDIKYSCIFTSLGFRCGYVKIPDTFVFGKLQKLLYLIDTEDSIFENSSYEFLLKDSKIDNINDLRYIPHGGTTYLNINSGRDRGFNKGLILGWDYGHYGDGNDYNYVNEIFPGNPYSDLKIIHSLFSEYPIASKEQVMKDIKNFIDKLIEIEKEYGKTKQALLINQLLYKPFKRKYKSVIRKRKGVK